MLKERLRQIALTLINLCAHVARRAAELAVTNPNTTRVAVFGFVVWAGARFGFEASEGVQSVVAWLTIVAAFFFASDAKGGVR